MYLHYSEKSPALQWRSPWPISGLPASTALPPPWAPRDAAVHKRGPAPLAAFPQLVTGPPLLPLKHRQL